jgi:hypothetical protein
MTPNAGTQPITSAEVERIWGNAGGVNTLGIFQTFDGLTTGWMLGRIDTAAVGDLLLLGDDPGGRWHDVTGGSFLVRDAGDTGLHDDPFVWREEWCLITVINPESGRRLLIDANKRALALWAQRQSGEAAPGHVGLITGELIQPVIFIGKALSPLWR